MEQLQYDWRLNTRVNFGAARSNRKAKYGARLISETLTL